uniref:Fibrillar collagen NC1 domain-containing protein n=2 Tax=Erpetoichthys calabaricus TaxID=27687 RepID=A0A8C4SDN9_ERPCA
MNFLHLLSMDATHSIIIHCLNTPVWNITNLNHQKKSVRFKGWNGQIFEANKLLEPMVLKDECKIQDGSWHQTHFLFSTQDSVQLPIVEIQRLPSLKSGQKYQVEVGPVCFL